MPYIQTMAAFLSQTVDRFHRAPEYPNQREALSERDLLEDLLPSGSGIDCGTRLLLDESKPNRLVLKAEFHHMNPNGFYVGWSTYKVIVKPCFGGLGIDVKVTGRDRNRVKDHLHNVYYWALAARVEFYLDNGERKYRHYTEEKEA